LQGGAARGGPGADPGSLDVARRLPRVRAHVGAARRLRLPPRDRACADRGPHPRDEHAHQGWPGGDAPRDPAYSPRSRPLRGPGRVRGGGAHARSGPPRRAAVATAGKWVGSAIQWGFLGSEPDYAATRRRHFSYLTAEYQMKWDPIQRERGVFDFSGGDAIVAFAEANGMRVKGHALVWHGATPSWVGTLSPRDLGDAVANHIRTVAGHYRGHVAAWD